jgi:hypothetical protein
MNNDLEVMWKEIIIPAFACRNKEKPLKKKHVRIVPESGFEFGNFLT